MKAVLAALLVMTLTWDDGWVAIFDAARVKDKADYLDPFQYPEGIEVVIVNGEVTVDHGRHTGARAGRVLRHGR